MLLILFIISRILALHFHYMWYFINKEENLVTVYYGTFTRPKETEKEKDYVHKNWSSCFQGKSIWSLVDLKKAEDTVCQAYFSKSCLLPTIGPLLHLPSLCLMLKSQLPSPCAPTTKPTFFSLSLNSSNTSNHHLPLITPSEYTCFENKAEHQTVCYQTRRKKTHFDKAHLCELLFLFPLLFENKQLSA